MTIPQRIYRFYLTGGSSVTEVFPLNFLETTLSDEQEKEQIFYRRKFTGSLTFVNNNGANDFDLIYAFELADPCAKIYLEIERNGDYYWNGYFSTTDGEIDIDKCTFKVTPLPYDDYAIILDVADIQHNILDILTSVSTNALMGAINIDYTHNRWLARLTEENVLEFLADLVLPGVTVSSDFFTDANNPATLFPNHLLYLTIAQKSDIIRPASTNPATTAMMSWNELMDILWGMFQVKWDYDSVTNTINVEHISWFGAAAGMDLRTQLMTRATNKYSYLKEKMPKYEKFAFAEADEINFVGTPIYYNDSCIDPNPDTNVKETQVNVTTDLEYIINSPDAIADEGFVILCNFVSGGNYYVEFTQGIISPSIKLNMHLSWANLQNAYFRHERVLIEGFLNGFLTDFWTARKTRQQLCSAIVCPADSYDPSDEITTELGETYFGGAKARVQSSKLKPSGEMDFTLLYGTEDNENTGVHDDLFIVAGTLTILGGTDYRFVFNFNKPAPADIDIRVRDYVYDELGVLQRTGGWNTITFSTGTITESAINDLCDVLDVDWCVKVEIEYDDSEIDFLTAEPDADESCATPFIYTIL